MEFRRCRAYLLRFPIQGLTPDGRNKGKQLKSEMLKDIGQGSNEHLTVPRELHTAKKLTSM